MVDDSDTDLRLIGTLLQGAGISVVPACRGQEALEFVEWAKIDLVLLDLFMPDMNGFEVCAKLRESPIGKELPVILVTAATDIDNIDRAFSEGAVDYVTKPFRAEELLARVETQLELKFSRDALHELNTEKSEFLGIAAHGMKNAIASVIGFTKFLREEEDLPREQVGEVLDDLLTCAVSLDEMVKELLDTNAIETGEIRVQARPCQLGEVAGSVVEAYRLLARGKDQEISFERCADDGVVLADPELLKQVLENLVSNAVKYSYRGRTIRIAVEDSEGFVTCAVIDDGPGLTEEDQGQLFSKFARLSARPTGGEHSTGLGLSIVKRMMEAMGGEVWCQSQPGKGATFTIRLPTAPEDLRVLVESVAVGVAAAGDGTPSDPEADVDQTEESAQEAEEKSETGT